MSMRPTESSLTGCGKVQERGLAQCGWYRLHIWAAGIRVWGYIRKLWDFIDYRQYLAEGKCDKKLSAMDYERLKDKGFTLIELVVAVALLAMVLSFSSVIFNVSIGAHRTAKANAEIMQKLRAITDQLNADFKGLQKDGYLILYCKVQENREEYPSPIPDTNNFRADRLYYFSTGDFQSWYAPNVRSNIARVYFGHDAISLRPNRFVSKWNLARDVALLTPEITTAVPADCNDVSYAACKVELSNLEDPVDLIINSVSIDTSIPDSLRNLWCEGVGEVIIEWTDGTRYPDNRLMWFGFLWPRMWWGWDGEAYGDIEEIDIRRYYYWARWRPDTEGWLWPVALKFTFTLYDSKGIIRGGRRFTHIVHTGDQQERVEMPG